MKKLWIPLAVAVLGFACQAEASSLSPKGKWEIGPIKAKAQDGLGYCSMKSAYDGGHSIVFARDAMGSNSIAIEFSEAKLEGGKQYPVNFSIGPIERHATGLAVGTKVLIAQMGADDVFYDMVAKKDVLYVSSDPGALSFNLKGTSKALMALENCAFSFSAAPPPKSVKQGLPPVFSGLVDGGFDPPIVSNVQSAMEKGEVVIQVKHPTVDEPPLGAEDDEPETASLELQRLRAENRALELENQANAERLKAAELGKKQKDSERETAVTKREQALRKENEKLQAELAAAKEKVKVKEKDVKTASTPAKETKSGMKALLLKAGVTSSETEIHSSGDNAYSWETGGVYGAAEQYPWPEGRAFHAVTEDYIADMRGRCQGDFAYTLGDVTKTKGNETAEAELACIGEQAQAAAALLFVADGAKMVVITYEGPTDSMPVSLEKRAQVASSLN